MCALWSVVMEFHTNNILFNVLVQNINQYKKLNDKIEQQYLNLKGKKTLDKNTNYIDLINHFDSIFQNLEMPF